MRTLCTGMSSRWVLFFCRGFSAVINGLSFEFELQTSGINEGYEEKG